MNFWARLDVALRARRLKNKTDIELHLLPALVQPSSLALDIGANKGVYTYHLQKLSRVHAFEPIPMLAKTLDDAGFRGVTVHHCGLGRERMTATLQIPHHRKRRRKLNTPAATFRALGGSTPDAMETFEIEVKRLDDFAFEDVSFVKLDVEGWEEHVLAGGEETFARNRPVLLIEIVEAIAPGIFDFLDGFYARHSYEMFFIARGERRIQPVAALDRTRPQADNFLAFPQERAAAFVADCNKLLTRV